MLDGVLGYAERAVAAGVARESVVIDPAHDFGKNTHHTLEVTRRLDEMVGTGWPVLVSLSNKDFVGETLDRPVDERLIGTLATTAVSAWLGARVYRVTRLRIVDDEPLAIEEAHLRGPLRGLATRLEEQASLYRVLREQYARAITAVEDTVETALASPSEAELLGVTAGHPLLMVHRLGRDADGLALEWTRSIYRGDRFKFVARATSPAATEDVSAGPAEL